MSDKVTQLDVQTMAALLGLGIPLIVGFVTHKYAHPVVKVVCNIAASIGFAVLAVWSQASGDKTVWLYVNTALAAFLASLTSYVAVWKPAFNINDALAPSKGIGKKSDYTPAA